MSLVYDYRRLGFRYMDVKTNQDGAGVANDAGLWVRCWRGYVGSAWVWIISD